MYNAKYIIPGIIFFLALAFVPVVYNMGHKFEVTPELPKDQKDCVLPTQEMREKHVKSLTNTCMSCHTDKAKFCDRCHDTVGVAPYCWDCHNLTPDQKSPIPPVAQAATGGH